jgi:hypothetical protein
VNIREAEALANKYDKTLLATDPRFRRSVVIDHDDGSHFQWDSAFLMRKENWILVFTEHHRFHVYDADDVHYRQFQRLYEEIEELP